LKIADFGIARVAEETTRLTQPGKVIGTDSYMAPEQLADGRITAATDVYACAVVPDEALPGERPPEMRASMHRCLRAEPPARVRDANALGKAVKGVENGDLAATAVRPARAGRSSARHERSTVFLPRTRADGELGTRRRFPDVGAGTRLGVALLLVGILVVGIILAAGSGGSSTSNQPSSSPQGSGSIPSSGDPAQQARGLADYLRQQAR